jgi:hypothetical protein
MYEVLYSISLPILIGISEPLEMLMVFLKHCGAFLSYPLNWSATTFVSILFLYWFEDVKEGASNNSWGSLPYGPNCKKSVWLGVGITSCPNKAQGVIYASVLVSSLGSVALFIPPSWQLHTLQRHFIIAKVIFFHAFFSSGNIPVLGLISIGYLAQVFCNPIQCLHTINI